MNTVTTAQLETFLDRPQTRVSLDESLGSAVKLGLLLTIVTDALNSEEALKRLREDLAKCPIGRLPDVHPAWYLTPE